MDRLKGKIALITGGASGIGLATAKLFRDEGAKVIITGRDQNKLAKAQQELGADVLVIRSEAGNLEDIDSLMSQIKERYSRLDVLLLNAAVLNTFTIDHVNEANFDVIMNVNVKGQFFAIQKALPLLGDKASIIAVTSTAAQKGIVNSPVYAASKAALRSLVRSLGAALISRGIRVNAISPGPITTEGFDGMGLPPEVVSAIINKSPIKRFGLPDEVAKAALFLASDDSSYLVGEEIVVDGGITQV